MKSQEIDRATGGDFAAAKSSNAVAHFSGDLNIVWVGAVVVDTIDEVWDPLTTKIDNVDSPK
jgi:hypothetical protein